MFAHTNVNVSKLCPLPPLLVTLLSLQRCSPVFSPHQNGLCQLFRRTEPPYLMSRMTATAWQSVLQTGLFPWAHEFPAAALEFFSASRWNWRYKGGNGQRDLYAPLFKIPAPCIRSTVGFCFLAEEAVHRATWWNFRKISLLDKLYVSLDRALAKFLY